MIPRTFWILTLTLLPKIMGFSAPNPMNARSSYLTSVASDQALALQASMQQAAQKAALDAARQVAQQAAQAAEAALAAVDEMEAAAQENASAPSATWGAWSLPPVSVPVVQASGTGTLPYSPPTSTVQQPISTPQRANQGMDARQGTHMKDAHASQFSLPLGVAPQAAVPPASVPPPTAVPSATMPPVSASAAAMPQAAVPPQQPYRQGKRAAPGTEYLGMVPGPKAQASSIAMPYARRPHPPSQASAVPISSPSNLSPHLNALQAHDMGTPQYLPPPPSPPPQRRAQPQVQRSISTPSWARQDDGGRARYSVQSPPQWASQGLDGSRPTPVQDARTSSYSLPPAAMPPPPVPSAAMPQAAVPPPQPYRQGTRAAPGTEYLGMVPGPKAQASSIARHRPLPPPNSPPPSQTSPPGPGYGGPPVQAPGADIHASAPRMAPPSQGAVQIVVPQSSGKDSYAPWSGTNTR